MKNRLNKINIDKIIYINIFILFVLLPINDCLRTTSFKDIEIFNIALIELGNIFLILFSLFLTFFRKNQNRQKYKLLFYYTILFVVYIILHNLHIIEFNTSIFSRANINFITETYYIFRVYYLPSLLLFILLFNRDIFNINFFKKIIKIIIIEISFSIVILNIVKLSYPSYGVNEFIDYNIFDFYKSNIDYKLLSTRGLFDSANEISAILLMLLPLNIFILYKDNRKFNYLLYIIQVLSMIIVGTRISSVGGILVSVCAILINIFARIVRKEKINVKFILIAIIVNSYFLISPVGLYLLNKEPVYYNSDDQYSDTLKEFDTDMEKYNYINSHLYDYRINEAFVDLYPIQNDIDFWEEVALGNRNDNNNSRKMKIKIIRRIEERNNNKIDKYLGMGYTINFMDLERDYIYQFYLFGICGIFLILLPNIYILIISFINVIKYGKKLNVISTLLLLMSPLIGLLAAYSSGHVLGWISPMFILTFSIGLFYIYLKEST